MLWIRWGLLMMFVLASCSSEDTGPRQQGSKANTNAGKLQVNKSQNSDDEGLELVDSSAIKVKPGSTLELGFENKEVYGTMVAVPYYSLNGNAKVKPLGESASFAGAKFTWSWSVNTAKSCGSTLNTMFAFPSSITLTEAWYCITISSASNSQTVSFNVSAK